MEANNKTVLEAVNRIYELVCKPCVVMEEVRQACCEARAIIISQDNQVGNAAGMRDALKFIKDAATCGGSYFGNPAIRGLLDQMDMIRSTANAALSEPTRNCDRFKDASSAIDEFQDRSNGGLIYDKVWNEFLCWLFEKAKGENDGK